MKKLWMRLVCLVVIAAMLPVAALADVPNDGGTIRQRVKAVGDAVSYVSTTLQHASAGRIEERIFIREATSSVQPIVVGGPYIYNSNLTLRQAAANLTAAGETVVGGVTGDMFTLSTGVPMGLVVRDGILRSCDNQMSALGVQADGRAVIGVPNLLISLSTPEQTIKIDKVNRVRDTGKLYLYTPDFSADTRTTRQGKHVVLTIGGHLKIGQSVTGIVKEIVSGAAAYPLKSGEMVLSASSDEPIARLDGLAVGQSVTISITASQPVWDSIVYGSGGYHRLVKDGTAISGLGSDKAPRTAVGILPDGGMVLYAVDGRQSGYSAGLSLTDVAARLISLGCVDALEFDGGGSTAAGVVSPGTTQFSLVNSPSDGQERKCAGYLFFVNRTPATAAAAHVFINGTEQQLLIGASAKFWLTAADSTWHAMPAPVAPEWIVEDNGVGEVASDGTFIARAAGTATLTGQAWGLWDSTTITVVDTIDQLSLINGSKAAVTALQGAPGTSVSLQAAAAKGTLPVTAQNTCFTWSVTGDVGSVSALGVFTYGSRVGATGKLTVSGGGKTLDIPVTVGTAPALLEGFENGSTALSAQGTGIRFTVDSSIKLAGRGLKSAKLDYAFTAGTDGAAPAAVTLPASITLAGSPKTLFLQLAGNGTKHILSASFKLASGETVQKTIGTLEQKDYQLKRVDVPTGSVKLTGFTLSPGEATLSGSFHLDHIMAAWAARDDMSPPTVELSQPSAPLNETLIFTADIHDAAGVALPRSGIEVVWDGVSQNFSYDVYAGKLSVTVPSPASGMHILSVTATDSFGNRRKVSHQVLLPRADNLSLFCDVKGRWMEPYVDFLDAKQVLTERESLGLRYFDPDQPLTRLEMVELVIRLMGVDTSRYASTVLPFADAAEIPAAALPAVKAAYALGIVAGIGKADGSVILGGPQAITRQDFCVIVLGALPKGAARKTLMFTDAQSVSAYAVEAVETFVSVGAVSGTDKNTFEPKRSISRAEMTAVLTKLFF